VWEIHPVLHQKDPVFSGHFPAFPFVPNRSVPTFAENQPTAAVGAICPIAKLCSNNSQRSRLNGITSSFMVRLKTTTIARGE